MREEPLLPEVLLFGACGLDISEIGEKKSILQSVITAYPSVNEKPESHLRLCSHVSRIASCGDTMDIIFSALDFIYVTLPFRLLFGILYSFFLEFQCVFSLSSCNDSHIILGVNLYLAIASARGSNGGPNSLSSNVRCLRSPASVYSILEKWQ